MGGFLSGQHGDPTTIPGYDPSGSVDVVVAGIGVKVVKIACFTGHGVEYIESHVEFKMKLPSTQERF